ncbi:hypothetical protein D3C87_1787200 [compost metagenome]
MDIELVAVGEFDPVVALHGPGFNHPIPGENASDRIAGKQPDFDATPRVCWPLNRQHRRQCFAVIAQHPLTGSSATGPDRRSIRQPPGKPTLARPRILIVQPTPGFHSQPAAKLAHDIAVGGVQNQIE